MRFEHRVVAIILLTASTIVYVISWMPPLTNNNSGLSPGISQEDFDRTLTAEHAFCQEAEPQADCACYAQISGIIQGSATPKIPNAYYADQQRLARDQAADRC